MAADGKRGPAVQQTAQLRLVWGAVQACRHPPESVGIAALAAKGEVRHHPHGGQQTDRTLGKALRRRHSVDCGQLQNQVCAALQRRAGAGPFVKNGARPPLNKVSAHHGSHGALPQSPAGLGDVVGMSPVEGIVFRHNTRHIHAMPPPCAKIIPNLVKTQKMLAVPSRV